MRTRLATTRMKSALLGQWRVAVWFGVCCVLAITGCVSPGRASKISTVEHSYDPPQIERGKPCAVVDGVGWVFAIPSKVVLWNSKVNNHHVSSESEARIEEFLAAHELEETKVRLNQYAPVDEWRRLAQNKSMSPGWRYTFGAFHTLGYTLMPGRVFGEDYYNPYTNTLNVYGDVPSISMMEGAYGADLKSREKPGVYAFSQEIAGLNMWHQTIAMKSALAHIEATGSAEEIREAYNVLYPRYGLQGGQALDALVPIPVVGNVFQIGGLVAGHCAGRRASSQVEDDPNPGESSVTAELADLDESGDAGVEDISEESGKASLGETPLTKSAKTPSAASIRTVTYQDE